MRKRDFPSLPLPFNVLFWVAPALVLLAVVLGVATIGYIAYLSLTGGLTPESIGAFFGKIAAGFEGARQ